MSFLEKEVKMLSHCFFFSLYPLEDLSLRYLDFSSCFPILSKFLVHLPSLVEVRIGADAPPVMKQRC